jgi:quercetin dioxygenase-like cupin family protein
VATPWSELPHDAPVALLERRRVIGSEAMISHVTLHRGCEVPVHAHVNEQFSCVLSGRVRFTLADGERVLGPGDVLWLPSHAPHGATALETAVVLDVFAPPSAATGVDARRA